MMTQWLELFWITVKIGAFTFGGGMAMVPLIQDTLVKAGLMTRAEAGDVLALSQITPGPFAVNAATFAGMRLYGVPGAVIATLGIMLPSVVIMAVVSRFFFSVYKNPTAQAALGGVRAVVLGLIASSAAVFCYEAFVNVGAGVWGNISAENFTVNTLTVGVAALAFALMAAKKAGPVICITAAGILGALFLR